MVKFNVVGPGKICFWSTNCQNRFYLYPTLCMKKCLTGTMTSKINLKKSWWHHYLSWLLWVGTRTQDFRNTQRQLWFLTIRPRLIPITRKVTFIELHFGPIHLIFSDNGCLSPRPKDILVPFVEFCYGGCVIGRFRKLHKPEFGSNGSKRYLTGGQYYKIGLYG